MKTMLDHPRTLSWLFSSALCFSAACAADSGEEGETEAAGEDGDGETGGDDSGDPSAVTYYEHVRPILIEECASCHTEGNIAPFVVGDYETDKAWGEAIRSATAARTMPPFNMNNDGSCNTFSKARWLSEEEIATIEAWAVGGFLAGDESIEAPEPPESEVLAGSAFEEIHVAQDYAPVADSSDLPYDDYQCFLAPIDREGEYFLTGFEVHPGNPAIVHHAVVFKVDTAQIVGVEGETVVTNGDQIQALQDANPDGVGWECDGSAGEGVLANGVPVAWAPGTGATNFPEGTGIKMKEGEVLVLQMHYNLVQDDGLPDNTSIEFSVADEVEKEGYSILMDEFLATAALGNPGSLEPGKESVEFTWDTTVAEEFPGVEDTAGVEIRALLPHMHNRGQGMSITFEDQGEEICGGDVDRWDFNWQQSYWLEEPLVLSPEANLSVTCNWNTMGDEAPIYAGFGTDNEMCLLGLYATAK